MTSWRTLTLRLSAARDKYKPMRLSTIAQMFRLLDNFSTTKNPSAPLLYKTLGHSLVENH